MESPYKGKDESLWKKITIDLINEHPLSEEEIVEAVITSWEQIFESTVGPLHIGQQIFPSPQIMSSILHELIPYNLASTIGDNYRIGTCKAEKDIVYKPDVKYCIEVKASSSKNSIYANRSYAQPSLDSDTKDKNGFYIAVNFEKFEQNEVGESRAIEYDAKGKITYPKITQIRFGYLEHTDWIPQKSAKGQQASLSPLAKKYKMKKIYPTR